MLYALFFSLAGDEGCVDVGTAEFETTQNTIGEVLEGLRGIPYAERHSEKLERAERVVMTVFGMSLGATIIWWCARTRSKVKKTVMSLSNETQSWMRESGRQSLSFDLLTI